MSEVEKMYRNAHIYPRVYGDITKETFENKVFNMGDMCNEAFTAEKQLEMIKWLVHYIKQINITDAISGEFYFTAFGYVGYMKVDFEEALASFINNLWQDLTEVERKQIRGILE